MKTPFKCILLDDERKDRENIRILINEFSDRLQVLGEAHDSKSFLMLLAQETPDIVFMDIQFSKETAFDILDSLETISFKIIFVTAFSDFAVRGYRYSAIDFLLKPINRLKLADVLERAFKKISAEQSDLMISSSKQNRILPLHDSRGIHLVSVYEIISCHSDGNYTRIKLTEDRELFITKNLKFFETSLAEVGFVRIHRKFLINKTHLKSVQKGKTPKVIMSNNDILRISRINKSEILKKLLKIHTL